jgi:undecaprenyl diphosphate synthase
MRQSTPRHVAIIMDGNGRWAARRGWPRPLGHRAGADAVRRTVRAAPGLGIEVLTLYAFSSDNWARPAAEVRALFSLFEHHLEVQAPELAQEGARLEVIGRRDRLPPTVRAAIERAEAATAWGTRLRLRVAVDYSARDAIARAAASLSGATPTHAAFAEALARASHTASAPDVDLLIRTGAERRLSDFLLWECAYAELRFLDILWPDFDGEALAAAVAEFARCDRRFGRVEPDAAPAAPAAPAAG